MLVLLKRFAWTPILTALKTREESIKNYKYLNIVFFIFLTLITLEFLSIPYPQNLLDFYHEGEWLSPAKNYLITGKIWSGTYFVHGGFFPK